MAELLFTSPIYTSVDDDKSLNSCLATVEAFSNLLVLRFIHVDRGKLSRYYELSLLNTVAKHQDTPPYHTLVWWHWWLECLVNTCFRMKIR